MTESDPPADRHPADRPADSPGDRPAGRPGGQPGDDQPGDRPAGQPADRPAPRRAGHPGDHPREEPVFIRVGWGKGLGGGRAYNPRNPAGLTMIFVSLAAVVIGFWWLHDSSNWSSGELRSAVRQAAEALQEEPVVYDRFLGLEMYIDKAIDDTGEGPGALVSRAGGPDADDYTVTGPGTDAAFCLRISKVPVDSAPPPGAPPGYRSSYVHLFVNVSEGRCDAASH
ncbi:hypothetical protein ACFWXK_04885 [Streptomyces sp. NPDC059070]|uniref:hypothetical protein n=1 Tax=Streptomyces sp. NPDC059070 TaxID=3346713 RepID=UPI003685827F